MCTWTSVFWLQIRFCILVMSKYSDFPCGTLPLISPYRVTSTSWSISFHFVYCADNLELSCWYADSDSKGETAYPTVLSTSSQKCVSCEIWSLTQSGWFWLIAHCNKELYILQHLNYISIRRFFCFAVAEAEISGPQLHREWQRHDTHEVWP